MSVSEYVRLAALRAKPMTDRVVHPTLPEINYFSYVELVEIKKSLMTIANGVRLSIKKGYPLPQELNQEVFEDIRELLKEIGREVTGLNLTGNERSSSKTVR